MISDFDLTEEDLKQIKIRTDELQVQSMAFDLDIDYETNSLRVRQESTTPTWLKVWNEKRHNSDNDPASPEQARA